MRWLDRCRAWVRRYDPVRAEHFEDTPEGEIHHYGFMRRLAQALPDDAIIVSDTGGNVIMMGHCFQSKAGQRIFTSNGNTPMGFALCGAIGAWCADPSRPIICIIGDGGFQLNIQELQTIKHYQIPVKVFVIDNGILGNTKSYQRVNGKAELACGPDGYSTPDFQRVSLAYGIFAAHMPHWDTFDSILRIVLLHDEPVVCVVPHHDYCTYEPRMSRWDCPIEEMHPPLSEEEFLANMSIEPLEGWKKRR